MNQKAFIVKNENDVNIIATRILLWATLAFPAIIILCILGIFTGKVNELVPLFSVGMVCAISPYILRKLHLNSTFIKYFTIIMSTVCVGILATNPHINVNIMYVFPIGLSCLYFDKRLTRITLILGLINIIVSKYFFCISYHALGKTDVADGFTYYIAILSGLLIEFFATTLIFSMLARRTKTLLESLVDSEEQTNLLNKLKEIMNKSLNASNVLASSANRLLKTIDEASKSNESIAGNASNASSGCEKNLEYVKNTSCTIENISAVLKSISIQSKEASQISKNTFTAAEESEKIIKDSIANMENVEASTTQSKELINKLGETSEQIGAIVEIITGITKQTNLLALNAAIEASRAGEHGKGFSVVAGEIRKLAEQSVNATQEISGLIKNIQENTRNAVESIDKNSETIRLGIDMVRGTGKSFEKLKNLQFNSNTRIQEIASSSDTTSEYGGKLLNIVNDIKSLTTKSLNEMESIAASTEQQTAAMQEISASFQVIDNIANDLLALSKSIDTI